MTLAATAYIPYPNQMSYMEPGRPYNARPGGYPPLIRQDFTRQPTTAGGLMGLLSGMFGGGGMFGGQGAGGAGAGGGMGPGGFNVQTPFRPAPIYDPTSLQIARNQTRAQVPTALASPYMHTGAGISSTRGTASDIAGRQNALRRAGEGETQLQDLQRQFANAQNILAGQTGAFQSALGLAGGQMDRMGLEQRLRYGLADLGLSRGGMGSNFLLELLNYL